MAIMLAIIEAPTVLRILILATSSQVRQALKAQLRDFQSNLLLCLMPVLTPESMQPWGLKLKGGSSVMSLTDQPEADLTSTPNLPYTNLKASLYQPQVDITSAWP